jgi:hypothetical protein
MHCLQHHERSSTTFITRLIRLFSFQLEILANSHVAVKLHSIILICQVCWPWIVSRKLSQDVHKL